MAIDDTTTERSRFRDNLRNLGPGLLVAAAFLGPGTITTASTAGADNAFQLLWALIFGVLAAMVLQEMNARLGVVTREGLRGAAHDLRQRRDEADRR